MVLTAVLGATFVISISEIHIIEVYQFLTDHYLGGIKALQEDMPGFCLAIFLRDVNRAFLP